jgi:hypothetical protein
MRVVAGIIPSYCELEEERDFYVYLVSLESALAGSG